jgi:DNA polymerase I-like protein with 3'-5' exonuclease and polymerase domains
MKLNRVKEPTCWPIETSIPIDYKVVGRREWLDGALAPGALPVEQRIEVHSASDLQPIKDWFHTQKYQGLDIETGGQNEGDGLDPISPTSKILLAQYGAYEHTGRKTVVYLLEPDLLPEFKEQLQSKGRLLIGQNIRHEFKFILKKYKFPLIGMFDTMLAEQLLTAGLPGVNVNLEELACKYPPHNLVSKDVRNKFINFRGGDKFTKEMLYYAARDVVLLFPVFEGQWPKLREHKLVDVAQTEFDLIAVTADMELTGINLDEKILRLTQSFYQERQDEINKRVTELYNRQLRRKGLRKQLTVMPPEDVEDHFDIDSSLQKLNALRALGYDVENVQRETLEKVDTELTSLLGEYSFCRKMTTTYGQSLLDKRSPWTGRFHPEFHQMGEGEGSEKHAKKTVTTATQRYSSNAQQIPRPEKRYALVKDKEELARVGTVFAEQLKQGIEMSSTAKVEPVFLGINGGKEYYLFPADNKQPKPYVQWRVPTTKEAFRATLGRQMLTADYSQIEVRIMAALSRDPWLTAAINSGKDIHCYMASDVYGIPYDEFYEAWKDDKHPKHDDYSKLRTNIKGTSFGVPYGAGAECVSNNTGLPLGAASDLITRFFSKARILKTWLDRQRAGARCFGYSSSLKGRKRFYRTPTMRAECDAKTLEKRAEAKKVREERESKIEREAGNQPIQASCVDLLKPAMVKIYLALRGGSWTGELIYDAHVILTVHDEIVVEAREDQAQDVAKLMEGCMQEAYTDIITTVSNKVDVTIADYWKK